MPDAAAVNVTVAPAATVWLDGWVVNTGDVLPPLVASVKSITSDGADGPSREAKRTAAPVSSCATMIQPKLAAGLFTHACTSATMPLAANVAVPELPLTRSD